MEQNMIEQNGIEQNRAVKREEGNKERCENKEGIEWKGENKGKWEGKVVTEIVREEVVV